MASILVDAPGRWAINYNLKTDRPNRIGRASDNDVVLRGSTISSRHAEITLDGDVWMLRDLGSKNGTYIKDQKLKEERLFNGTTIRFGSEEVYFRNPDEVAPDPSSTVWGHTCVKLARESERFKDSLSSGEVDEVIDLPDILTDVNDGPDSQSIAAAAKRPTDPILGPKDVEQARAEQAKLKAADDALWVAEELAKLLGEMVTHKGDNKNDMYKFILTRLLDETTAENAFLMIPNKETKQWVIRAWVGDEVNWSEYEKEHPISLTVANKAYSARKIVCNSLDELKVDPTASLQKLQVQNYLAVPFSHDGNRAGVIYMDIRRGMQRFERRHIRLLQRMAEYIVQIEFQEEEQ